MPSAIRCEASNYSFLTHRTSFLKKLYFWFPPRPFLHHTKIQKPSKLKNCMLVKLLGIIDFIAALVFLLLIIGVALPFQFLIFPALLLFAKSLFILKGDALSLIDMLCAAIIFLSIFFSLPSLFLWIPLLLLVYKVVVSFI